MNIAKFIALAIKIKKLFKSSGKGVFGLSKTVIGIMILILPVFGLEHAAGVIKGQDVELSTSLFNIITGIGVIVTAWGAIAKNDKIDTQK